MIFSEVFSILLIIVSPILFFGIVKSIFKLMYILKKGENINNEK
jgi:hypothetical protein